MACIILALTGLEPDRFMIAPALGCFVAALGFALDSAVLMISCVGKKTSAPQNKGH
jgi:hypothetical protein